MFNLRKEMENNDLDNLIKLLEENDDEGNTFLLLQMIQLNLEAQIEEDKKKHQSENKSKVELKKKINYIIAGFLSKSQSIIGNNMNISDFVEKETGFSILPKTAEERSSKSEKIINALIKNKCKRLNITISETNNRKETILKLKKIKTELEKNNIDMN